MLSSSESSRARVSSAGPFRLHPSTRPWFLSRSPPPILGGTFSEWSLSLPQSPWLQCPSSPLLPQLPLPDQQKQFVQRGHLPAPSWACLHCQLPWGPIYLACNWKLGGWWLKGHNAMKFRDCHCCFWFTESGISVETEDSLSPAPHPSLWGALHPHFWLPDQKIATGSWGHRSEVKAGKGRRRRSSNPGFLLIAHT